MKKTDKEYLSSIIEAIDWVRHHQKNPDKYTSERAIIYELIIIGEASNQINARIRDKYDNIPWADIVGFRNILIHQYLGIEMDTVKYIVDNELDELKENIIKILREI